MLVSGANPIQAYSAIVAGSLAPDNLPNTLNWATPLVGMTLAAAIPLRGGMINLGGDGQMVVGGLVGATAPLLLPAPGPLAATLALVAATVAGGLYAALAAWGEIRFAIPMLISSLLLSYPAVGIVSYLVRFPLRDTTTGLPQTALVPVAARLPTLVGPVNAGMLVIAAVAALVVVVDRRAVIGYELQNARPQRALRRLRRRARSNRQALGAMFASGAIAGLVGAIVVLGGAIPLHRRRAADAGLYLVGPDGGAARGRRAGRRDRWPGCSSRRCRPAASRCSAKPPCRAC